MNAPYQHLLRLGLTSALALALALLWTESGTNVLAWVYKQSAQALMDATRIPPFSLNRFDPTCPQCM
jgi:hypothetical protein